MATSEVDQILHFQKANLIETAGKDINDMAVIGSAFSEIVIELS